MSFLKSDKLTEEYMDFLNSEWSRCEDHFENIAKAVFYVRNNYEMPESELFDYVWLDTEDDLFLSGYPYDETFKDPLVCIKFSTYATGSSLDVIFPQYYLELSASEIRNG